MVYLGTSFTLTLIKGRSYYLSGHQMCILQVLIVPNEFVEHFIKLNGSYLFPGPAIHVKITTQYHTARCCFKGVISILQEIGDENLNHCTIIMVDIIFQTQQSNSGVR